MPDAIYFLDFGVTGAVGRHTATDRVPVIVKVYRRGQHFGEVSVVRGGLRRLNVVALTWTRVMLLTVSDWESLTEAFPELREVAEASICDDVLSGAPLQPNGKRPPPPREAKAAGAPGKVVEKVTQLIRKHAPNLDSTSSAALAAAMAVELASARKGRRKQHCQQYRVPGRYSYA